MKALYSLALAALLLAACKKDDLDPNGLVPATQEGKNTGDFLLNGQPYNPGRSKAYPGQAVGANWYKIRNGRKIIIILGREYEKERKIVNIVLCNITQSGKFVITEGVTPAIVSGNKSYIIYSALNPGPARRFLTGPDALGQVMVTRYDTLAHVISGTFEAKLREYNGSDSLSITQGRFDCTF